MKWLQLLIKIIISITLLIWLISSVNISLIFSILFKIEPSQLVLVFILAVIAWAVAIYKWNILLSHFRYLDLAVQTFVGSFYSLVLPGQIAGELVKTYRLGKGRVDAEQVAVSVVVDKITGLLGLLLVMSAGLFASVAYVPEGVSLSILLLTIMLLVSLACVRIPMFARAIERMLDSASRRDNWFTPFVSRVGLLYQAWANYLRQPLRLVWATLMGGVFQLLCVWINANFALILGINLAFADWCWIIGLVSIALLLPITIAGFGVREGVFVSLLALQGVSAEKSIALSLCVFGVSFISALIGCFLECIHIVNKARDGSARGNQKNHNIFTYINNLHVSFMIKITHNRLPVVSMFLKFLGVSLVYISFAAFVYLAHGAEPELSIDHVAYFKMAKSILGNHPDGSYWKEINSTKSYAVLMAYAYGVTGSHILSLKWILAGLTVLHLYAFQLIMSLFTPDCWKQILFSLLGAFYVSFGATFWGVTDFSASLNRTAVLPLILFAIWFFIKKWDSPVKNIIFPLLMVGSIIHLSVYYIIGVLALMEMSSLVIEQRFRLNTRMFSFILMLAVTVFLQTLISQSSLGTGSYISQAATQGVSRIVQNQATTDNATQGVNRIVQNQATTDNVTILSPQAAWGVELYAFPWRNMPLPIATLITMFSSVSFIFLLAVLGLRKCIQNRLQKLDWIIIYFAMSILIMAYGLQTTLWLCRSWLPVYPINFEEVRVINFIMIPFLYFIFRVFDDQLANKTLPSYGSAALIVIAVIIQPITIIRTLPNNIKNIIIQKAFDLGVINPGDSLRLLYARQYLGIAGQDGRRFYYSALGILGWLKENAQPSDRVLTDLNEIHLLNLHSIGNFNAMVDMQIKSRDRYDWMVAVKEIGDILSRHDTKEVVELAKKYQANLAIVPWEVKGAVYSDNNYSVIRIK